VLFRSLDNLFLPRPYLLDIENDLHNDVEA